MRATAFVITAAAVAFARDLRAETGPLYRCDAPELTSCAGDAGAPCTCSEGTTCACVTAYCTSDEGGPPVPGLRCGAIGLCSSLGDLASCDGKNHGDSCGGDRSCQNAYCYALVDGRYVQDAGTLACLAPLGGSSSGASGNVHPSDDGGGLQAPSSGSSSDSSCSCKVPGAAAASCAPAIAIAALAILRMRRRR